jgi:hypothetical protein
MAPQTLFSFLLHFKEGADLIEVGFLHRVESRKVLSVNIELSNQHLRGTGAN